MLLLNGILDKGFDGGNMILGLAQHVRNVLMAKDAKTLPLLETSEAQKAKYQQQAQKAPTPFLYKALQISQQMRHQLPTEFKQTTTGGAHTDRIGQMHPARGQRHSKCGGVRPID